MHYLQENFSGSSGSSQDKDFGFQNRPRVVGNTGVSGKSNGKTGTDKVVNHTIIVTPVPQPQQSDQTEKLSSNGVMGNPGRSDNVGSTLCIANSAQRQMSRQNMTARYAVNYRWSSYYQQNK